MMVPANLEGRPGSLIEFIDFLGFDLEVLDILPAILGDSRQFYRGFEIPKRSGGVRVINVPYPSLASIQRGIYEQILDELPVHPCAFAYKKNSNAIQHASAHVEQAQLLTLDIEGFFSSITRQMVFQAFAEAGLPSKFCYFASLLCCLDGKLPQGACTSPKLSNLIFRNLDERLDRLAKKVGLVYTRYADDLAFSGELIPRPFIRAVGRILGSKNFQLNKRKTRLKFGRAKKIITGVSISSGVVKAPKSFKRGLRAQIHELEKNLENLACISPLDPFIFERVLGRLNYLLQIEPDNKYALEKKKIISIAHQGFLGNNSRDLIERVAVEVGTSVGLQPS